MMPEPGGGGPGPALGFEHAHEPSDEDGPFTVLLLHGTGATQHDLLPLGRAVAPGKPLLSPLGKVRERGMPRWFARHEEGVFDEASIRERAQELAGFLDRAAEAYGIDRYLALGFSNGANIAASLLLLHPEALAGAVLLRAMTPLVPDELPDLTGVPVYIASGERDELVPAEDARRLARMLEDAGAEATHRFADAGHQLAREEIPGIREWIAQVEPELAPAREGSA